MGRFIGEREVILHIHEHNHSFISLLGMSKMELYIQIRVILHIGIVVLRDWGKEVETTTLNL